MATFYFEMLFYMKLSIIYISNFSQDLSSLGVASKKYVVASFEFCNKLEKNFLIFQYIFSRIIEGDIHTFSPSLISLLSLI